MSSLRTTFLLLGLPGCAQDEIPASCTQMCTAAVALYGTCLTEWGVDWTDVGYADAEAFELSCQTWAWEMSVLEEHALAEGQISQAGWLEQTCRERQTQLSQDDAECSVYTDIDWNDTPWEQTSVRR